MARSSKLPDAKEMDTAYAMEDDRFVVSYILTYSEEEVGPSAKKAAAAALELTRDPGSADTLWYVYDRKTGEMHVLEQEDFWEIEIL